MDPSVDVLIQRHKERLQEHRRFLDGDQADPYTSPRLDVDLRKWGPPKGHTASPPHATASTGATRGGGGSHPPTPHGHAQGHGGATGAAAVSTPRSTIPSARSYRSSGGGGGASTAATMGATAHDGRDSPLRTPGMAVPGHRLGVSPKEDPPSETRYYTTDPTRMADRSEAWIASRARKLAALQEEEEQRRLGECSFQPRTHSEHYDASPVLSAPHVLGPDSPYYQPPVTDIGEANFLDRQRSARQLKDSAQSKLVPDTSKWRNRVTVPVAFEWAKRDTPIPALRRPLPQQQQPRMRRPSTAAGSSAASSAASSRATSPAVSRAPQHQQQHQEHTQPKKNTTRSSRRAESSEGGGAAAAPRNSQHGGESDDDHRNIVAAEMAALRAELAAQRKATDDLKVQLAISQRELQVARATIRDLSLNPAAAGH